MKKALLFVVIAALLCVSAVFAEDPAPDQLNLTECFPWEMDRVAVSNYLSQFHEFTCAAALDESMHLVITCNTENEQGDYTYDFVFALTGEYLSVKSARVLPEGADAEAAAKEVLDKYEFDGKDSVALSDVPSTGTWSADAVAVKDGDVYMILDNADTLTLELIDGAKITN